MANMILPSGETVLIDDADLEIVSRYKWYIQRRPDGHLYVQANCRREGVRGVAVLHRVVLNPPNGVPVDHINGNGLDNRRCNLRLCDARLNGANHKRKCRSRTGFWGVSKRPSGNYHAQITRGGKTIHLGAFSTPEDAARARDVAAIKEYGEFAALNFPLGATGNIGDIR
jgi:hypothetical protein